MKSHLLGAVHANLLHAAHSIRVAGFLFNVAGLCAGLFIAVSTQAAFQVVENFDSLILGDIKNQNGWIATTGSGTVILDPADDSNQALEVNTDSGFLYKAASVDHATTRMLFLRFRFVEHNEFSFGLSHLSNPFQYSDFGPELGMASASSFEPNNELRVANSLTTGIYDALDTLMPGSWYNIWVLIDKTSERYQVWINSVPGGDAQAGDQLLNDVAEGLFGFRTPTSQDLINFFIKTATSQSPVEGRFYIDDIYLEDSDGTNLTNPLDPKILMHLPWLQLLLLNGNS